MFSSTQQKCFCFWLILRSASFWQKTLRNISLFYYVYDCCKAGVSQSQKPCSPSGATLTRLTALCNKLDFRSFLMLSQWLCILKAPWWGFKIYLLELRSSEICFGKCSCKYFSWNLRYVTWCWMFYQFMMKGCFVSSTVLSLILLINKEETVFPSFLVIYKDFCSDILILLWHLQIDTCFISF